MTSSLQTHITNPPTTDPNSIETLCADIRHLLEKRKAQLYEELRNYPAPIARCDEHFTHLMEKRANVFQSLSQMEALCASNPSEPEWLAWLEAFIATPVDASDVSEQAIRMRSRLCLTNLRR